MFAGLMISPTDRISVYMSTSVFPPVSTRVCAPIPAIYCIIADSTLRPVLTSGIDLVLNIGPAHLGPPLLGVLLVHWLHLMTALASLQLSYLVLQLLNLPVLSIIRRLVSLGGDIFFLYLAAT